MARVSCSKGQNPDFNETPGTVPKANPAHVVITFLTTFGKSQVKHGTQARGPGKTSTNHWHVWVHSTRDLLLAPFGTGLNLDVPKKERKKERETAGENFEK